MGNFTCGTKTKSFIWKVSFVFRLQLNNCKECLIRPSILFSQFHAISNSVEFYEMSYSSFNEDLTLCEQSRSIALNLTLNDLASLCYLNKKKLWFWAALFNHLIILSQVSTRLLSSENTSSSRRHIYLGFAKLTFTCCSIFWGIPFSSSSYSSSSISAAAAGSSCVIDLWNNYIVKNHHWYNQMKW